jgi:hypothetical protein
LTEIIGGRGSRGTEVLVLVQPPPARYATLVSAGIGRGTQIKSGRAIPQPVGPLRRGPSEVRFYRSWDPRVEPARYWCGLCRGRRVERPCSPYINFLDFAASSSARFQRFDSRNPSLYDASPMCIDRIWRALKALLRAVAPSIELGVARSRMR